jgi:hypothetical protein
MNSAHSLSAGSLPAHDLSAHSFSASRLPASRSTAEDDPTGGFYAALREDPFQAELRDLLTAEAGPFLKDAAAFLAMSAFLATAAVYLISYAA